MYAHTHTQHCINNTHISVTRDWFTRINGETIRICTYFGRVNLQQWVPVTYQLSTEQTSEPRRNHRHYHSPAQFQAATSIAERPLKKLSIYLSINPFLPLGASHRATCSEKNIATLKRTRDCNSDTQAREAYRRVHTYLSVKRFFFFYPSVAWTSGIFIENLWKVVGFAFLEKLR